MERANEPRGARLSLPVILMEPRAGHPEDIAKMALFLASDDSEWLSGQAMVVDGAETAGGTARRQRPPEEQDRILPVPMKGFMGPSFEG